MALLGARSKKDRATCGAGVPSLVGNTFAAGVSPNWKPFELWTDRRVSGPTFTFTTDREVRREVACGAY